MADLSTNERADAILAVDRRCNLPHPDKPGMRVMGWVVPEDIAGLGTGILAIEEIQRRAQLSRNAILEDAAEHILAMRKF